MFLLGHMLEAMLDDSMHLCSVCLINDIRRVKGESGTPHQGLRGLEYLTDIELAFKLFVTHYCTDQKLSRGVGAGEHHVVKDR